MLTLLKKLRLEAGIEQQDLAAQVNIYPTSFTRMENGQRRLPERIVADLCRILGVPPGALTAQQLQAPAPRENWNS